MKSVLVSNLPRWWLWMNIFQEHCRNNWLSQMKWVCKFGTTQVHKCTWIWQTYCQSYLYGNGMEIRMWLCLRIRNVENCQDEQVRDVSKNMVLSIWYCQFCWYWLNCKILLLFSQKISALTILHFRISTYENPHIWYYIKINPNKEMWILTYALRKIPKM